MKNFVKLIFLAFFLFGSLARAQSAGEDLGSSPEDLDAAYSAEDAAREAALWSDEIIPRDGVDPLGRLVAEADLILRGEVVSQTYSYDGTGVPFTHTTLTVSEVLRGDYTGSEYTVVQEGGPSRDNEKRAMMVSRSKHFRVGEEEMLFLQLASSRPAAGIGVRSRIGPVSTGPETVDVQHRFRILEGRVYNEDGYGVIVEPVAGGKGHRLRHSSDRHPAARFREIHVGKITLQKQFTNRARPSGDRADSGPGVHRGGQSAAPGYMESSDVATLAAAINQ